MLSKYIVAMRPYESKREEIHQQNHQQPADEVRISSAPQQRMCLELAARRPLVQASACAVYLL